MRTSSVPLSRPDISLQLLANGKMACDAEPKTSRLTSLFPKSLMSRWQALTILWLQGSVELEILKYSMTLWSSVPLLFLLMASGCVIRVAVSVNVIIRRTIVKCERISYRWNNSDVDLAPRLLLRSKAWVSLTLLAPRCVVISNAMLVMVSIMTMFVRKV